VLERAQLIERKIQARWRVCSLRRDRLAEAQEWIGQIRQFWDESFDRLQVYLDAEDQPKPKPEPKPKRKPRSRE
jgi:hypothetical protein